MKTLLALVLLTASINASAQLKGFSIGPYAEMGWPKGGLAETNKTGLGAGLGADIRFGSFGITGSVGYMQFPGQSVATGEGTFKYNSLAGVPVRAGIKFRPIPLLYFKVEGGAINLNADRGTAIIFAPAIGVRLLGLDVAAKFETWRHADNYSFWGIKAGYNF